MVALIAAGWAIVGGVIDMRAVHEETARLNGAVVFALLVLLPLIGVPVAPLHFAMGIRFGILLGVGVAKGFAHFAKWPIVVSPTAIILAFAVAAGIGIFFGFYPARKASRLLPIQALRYE